MENEIPITKKELEHLRLALLSYYETFDKEANGNMELNTHKKNYTFLAKKLTDLIQDVTKYRNTYMYKSIGTSQLLAFVHDTNQGDPKAFLVEAFYPYIYGEKRSDFFKTKEGKELLSTWNSETTTETVLPLDIPKVTEPTSEEENNTQADTLQVVEIAQPFWVKHIKIIALIALAIIGLNGYLAYKYYNKFQLEKLWAMPPLEEEIALKNRMTFVANPAFQNVVLDCIHVIETQYQQLAKSVTKSSVSDELIYYNDAKNSEELSLMGYHFYTGFATWWSSNPLTLGLQDTVHTLFDNLVDSSFIQSKNRNSYDPKAPFYMKEFLRVNQSEFLPVSIFTVFHNPSTEIMVRYPPFKEHKDELVSYVLRTRQWFKDAYGTDKYTIDRNNQIHWTFKNRTGQTINAGLSQPFLSVRKGIPLHRVLWFKIPTESRDSLLFCVNMVLNNQ
jgi:hypothetical protein